MVNSQFGFLALSIFMVATKPYYLGDTDMVRVAKIIETKLKEALQPTHLEVIDESEKHRGHAGYRDGGESHFHVIVKSDMFEGKNRVTRQRLVMHALEEELKGPIHALSMETKTPNE
jgi:BolA protein